MTGLIPADVQCRVRAAAKNRCGYCLARQEYTPWLLEIEHIVSADDSVRLPLPPCGGVDDRLLIEQWQDQSAIYSAEVSLTQGYHRVRLEYYEAEGSAEVRLSW